MAEKFEVRVEAERFIHNELSNCAWDFQQRMQSQIENDERAGIYHTMLASLVFSAFSIEAKVNFVGWKVLRDGWPEKANLREKLNLLNEVLKMDLSWGKLPLQTILKLKRLRDVLAHGKPEIVEKFEVVEVEPDVWDALKGQWETSVTPKFVDQCREAEDELWKRLLAAAGIEMDETLTHGGHSLKKIVEPD